MKHSEEKQSTKLPPEHARSKLFAFKLTLSEFEKLKKLAKGHRSISDFIREKVLKS